ncbi:MAG: sigma-70 family RNA polymerase sigma factor [Prevotella sp.]|jgi:RNA polymerase sigma-70 factor (ECF subfamily)|nr:sigma-70 family RNA polymerase sigma factor [Prevotella sp.]
MESRRIEIDEKSLRELFNLYVIPLTEFLSFYTRNKEDIEDVIQNVFIRIWEERNLVDIFYIKTYLYKAARNQILTLQRNQKNREVLLDKWANELIQDIETTDIINREEFQLLYLKAVESLPPKCKDIYVLCREEKLSYKEISELKGISEKTVENQMSIALKKLKEYLVTSYNKDAATIGFICVYLINELI